MKGKAFHENVLIYWRFLRHLRTRWIMNIFSRDMADICSNHPSLKQTFWIFTSHNPRDWSKILRYWCSVLIASSWSYSSFVTNWISAELNWEKQWSVMYCENILLALSQPWKSRVQILNVKQAKQTSQILSLQPEEDTIILGALLSHCLAEWTCPHPTVRALCWKRKAAISWDQEGSYFLGPSSRFSLVYAKCAVPQDSAMGPVRCPSTSLSMI